MRQTLCTPILGYNLLMNLILKKSATDRSSAILESHLERSNAKSVMKYHRLTTGTYLRVKELLPFNVYLGWFLELNEGSCLDEG